MGKVIIFEENFFDEWRSKDNLRQDIMQVIHHNKAWRRQPPPCPCKEASLRSKCITASRCSKSQLSTASYPPINCVLYPFNVFVQLVKLRSIQQCATSLDY